MTAAPTPAWTTGPDSLPEATLVEIERTAVELARVAGAEITSALGRTLAVRYKSLGEEEDSLRDPVSEVDHQVELLIRSRLAERFPDHGILGEEMEAKAGADRDVLWAIDPIDGTTNFVNGFPLFSGSIGVLHHGRPVVAALWCSISHALRAGVYHTRLGGALRFDDEPIEPKLNPAVRRRLAGEPEVPAGSEGPWDVRKTGSAAIECAFAAAGLLRVARFARPNLWDVAGGVALVLAAGGAVQVREEDGWAAFTGFGTDNPSAWRKAMVLGEPEAVAIMCRLHGG